MQLAKAMDVSFPIGYLRALGTPAIGHRLGGGPEAGDLTDVIHCIANGVLKDRHSRLGPMLL